MIEKGQCICLDSKCKGRFEAKNEGINNTSIGGDYATFPLSEALFRLENMRIKFNKPSVSKAKEIDGEETESKVDPGFGGTGRSEQENSADEEHDLNCFIRIDENNEIDPDYVNTINKENFDDLGIKCVEASVMPDTGTALTTHIVNVRLKFCKNGEYCTIGNHPTLVYRYCPHCFKELPYNMGFLRTYIIMPVGDTKFGKTSFLREAYRLIESSGLEIDNYSVKRGDRNEDEKTKIRLKMQGKDAMSNISSTDTDEDLYAYFKVRNDTDTCMFIFKDTAGEIIALNNSDDRSVIKYRLINFARVVDAFLVFSLPYHTNTLRTELKKIWWGMESENNSKIDLKQLFGDMVNDRGERDKKFEDAMQDDRNSEVLHYILDSRGLIDRKAGMYVFTMTDIFEKVVDKLDLSISSKSLIFAQKKFSMENYLNCAFETAYFLNKEDEEYRNFMDALVRNEDERARWNVGVAAISAKNQQSRMLDYVFGWLIKCLIEKQSFDRPLSEQSIKDYKAN